MIPMTDFSHLSAGAANDETTALLLLPRLRVQNANAISGPLTWGFPSPTAFTGFVHALERKFSDRLRKGFGGVGIVCHRFEPQVFQPPGAGKTQVFRLTRNPVGRDGAPTALVEEGRAHMEVSLLIAVKDYFHEHPGKDFAEEVLRVAQSMRLAGGSVLPPPDAPDNKRYAAQWWSLPEDREGQIEVFRKLRRQLLPGFALVQREDLLRERLQEIRTQPRTQPVDANAAATPPANALDALLDLCRLNHEPESFDPNQPGEVQWTIRAKPPGWLVPLPIGYSALSPLYAAGEVANTRDDSTPFRFVESLYSLGQWLSPHRLEHFEALLWHAQAEPENGLYRCINRYADKRSAITDTSINPTLNLNA